MIVATCFDTMRCACPQIFAFTIPYGQCTRKTPPTYAYTSFISDLVLVKLEAVGKHLGKLLLFAWLLTGHIVCGHVAIITKPSPQFLVCDVVLIPGLLLIFLHGCEIKSGSSLETRLPYMYTYLSEERTVHHRQLYVEVALFIPIVKRRNWIGRTITIWSILSWMA